jgi:hypothetical protein
MFTIPRAISTSSATKLSPFFRKCLMKNSVSTLGLAKAVFAMWLLMLLQACSVGKTYKEINPEGALQDTRKNNGYFSLKSVPPGKSKVVFRSDGAPPPVEFSICASATSCEQFESVGKVANPGHGVVYPWIAKLNNKANRVGNHKPYLEQLMTPGQTIHVRGFSKWMDSSGLFVASRECGPLFTVLTPQEGHAYLIEFVWTDGNCKQLVFDATNPDAPVALAEPEVHVEIK